MLNKLYAIMAIALLAISTLGFSNAYAVNSNVNTMVVSSSNDVNTTTTVNCVDSDSNNIFLKGTSSNKQTISNVGVTPIIDVCVVRDNKQYVSEALCVDDKATKYIIECPENYICSDGACVIKTPETTVPSTPLNPTCDSCSLSLSEQISQLEAKIDKLTRLVDSLSKRCEYYSKDSELNNSEVDKSNKVVTKENEEQNQEQTEEQKITNANIVNNTVGNYNPDKSNVNVKISEGTSEETSNDYKRPTNNSNNITFVSETELNYNGIIVTCDSSCKFENVSNSDNSNSIKVNNLYNELSTNVTAILHKEDVSKQIIDTTNKITIKYTGENNSINAYSIDLYVPRTNIFKYLSPDKIESTINVELPN